MNRSYPFLLFLLTCLAPLFSQEKGVEDNLSEFLTNIAYAEDYKSSEILTVNGTCRILSQSGKEVVIGLARDDVYDNFFGLQTDNDYNINSGAHRCRVTYARELGFIFYQGLDKDVSYLFVLEDKAEKLKEFMPASMREKTIMLKGYAVRHHKGSQYDFFDFID